jgi:hypothetical protein
VSVYQLDASHTIKPTQNNQTWLDHAAKLEQRLERGRHIDDSVRAWLQKSPERWALWLEMLASADGEGVVSLDRLHSWAWLDTKRKRRYFVRTLADFGTVLELDHGKVKVTA